MYFPNGDIQECDYKSGRANGEGTLVTVAGSEMKGADRVLENLLIERRS